MVTINVTQEHIDAGVRGDVEDCALGLAFKDAFDLDVDDQLLIDTIGVAIQGHRYAYLPEHVAKWADSFDRGRPVAPISFELDIEEVPDEELIEETFSRR